MRLQFTFLLILCAIFLNAQTVVDFEEFNLTESSFLNGDDGSGGFTSGDIFLPNNYNPNYMSWSGWAISSMTDVTTAGFTNQFSAITNGGFNGSDTYAVTSAFGNNNLILQGDALSQTLPGMYITNSTYAYLSMLDGDAFAKKFGGLTGDDPDFLLLTIKAYYNGYLSSDSVNFYLADYRSSANSEDYIVDEWTWVDLSSLGAVDSLTFALSSSDVGQFGMNTPAYFCIDNVFATDPLTSAVEISLPQLVHIFPNPTADFIQIEHPLNEQMNCTILNASGHALHHQKINRNDEQISLRHLPAGIYYVLLQGEEVFLTQKVMKR